MHSVDDRTTGSLQISTEVVEKIARHAALEVEGVHDVVSAGGGAKSLLGRLAQPKPIQVEIKNDVADLVVSLAVAYGTRIPELSEKVQQSVKDAVQSMTSITVARVDVIIAGLAADASPKAG